MTYQTRSSVARAFSCWERANSKPDIQNLFLDDTELLTTCEYRIKIYEEENPNHNHNLHWNLDKTESCQLIADGAGNRYGVTSVKIQDTQR